jgi:hypothetical protein
MSNLFQQVLTNAGNVEEKLLGPTYPYYKNIKMPNEIGMSDRGTIQQMGTNIDGLIQYVEVLVSGKSKASSTGQPLGNKFFLQTGAKCTDTATKQDVDRYIYIDNVPTGNIPFVSSGMGVNFNQFTGLIPGAMSDLNYFNPFTIMQAFLSGGKPDCQELVMETIDVNNNKSTESNFVSLVDIQNMDPCIFTLNNKVNPITNVGCKETFTNYQYGKKGKKGNKKSNDLFVNGYFTSLSILAIYIIYCMMTKMKR